MIASLSAAVLSLPTFGLVPSQPSSFPHWILIAISELALSRRASCLLIAKSVVDQLAKLHQLLAAVLFRYSFKGLTGSVELVVRRAFVQDF